MLTHTNTHTNTATLNTHKLTSAQNMEMSCTHAFVHSAHTHGYNTHSLTQHSHTPHSLTHSLTHSSLTHAVRASEIAQDFPSTGLTFSNQNNNIAELQAAAEAYLVRMSVLSSLTLKLLLLLLSWIKAAVTPCVSDSTHSDIVFPHSLLLPVHLSLWWLACCFFFVWFNMGSWFFLMMSKYLQHSFTRIIVD